MSNILTMTILLEVVFWTGVVFTVVGFGCLAIVKHRHSLRFGGQFCSLSKKPVDADLRLLKIGVISLLGGLVFLIIAALSELT